MSSGVDREFFIWGPAYLPAHPPIIYQFGHKFIYTSSEVRPWFTPLSLNSCLLNKFL